jgi:hypothetical protein
LLPAAFEKIASRLEMRLAFFFVREVYRFELIPPRAKTHLDE